MAVERKRARFAKARLSPASLIRRTQEARRRLEREGDQLPKCAKAYLRARRSALRETAARLRVEPVAARARLGRDRLLALSRRADVSIDGALGRVRTRLAQAARLADSLSHQAVLARGFALVRDADDVLVKRAAELGTGEAIAIEFADGTVQAVTSGAGPSRPSRASRPKGPQGQGSLF